MEEEGHVSRVVSSSRLSAKAQPFMLNRFSAQPTWTSSRTSVDHSCDSLLTPLSNVKLEANPSTIGSDSRFKQHPSANSASNCGHVASNKCASSAYGTLLDQGKPGKKSKLNDINSESARKQCSDSTMGKENPFISRSKEQLDVGIFTSSEVNSVATPHEFPVSPMWSASESSSQPQLAYTAPATSWNHRSSTMAFDVGHGSSDTVDEDKKRVSKIVSGEGSGPLLMDKSNQQVGFKKVHDKNSSDNLDAKTAVSHPSKIDENDSDVDSPCWRGTLASRESPFVSRALSSDFTENVQEGSYSLNPLAPRFIPRPSKAIVDCYMNERVADDFSSSFQKRNSVVVSAVSSFSNGKISVDTSGSKSSINGIGIQTSDSFYTPKREYALLNCSASGSVLNFPEGVSKLLSTHSGLGVSTILNMMLELSELLVQNCPNDVNIFNEHDLIPHIVNNLYTCFQHKAGGTPIPDFTLTGTPYCPNKSTELFKVVCSNMGFQVTNTRDFAFPHELDSPDGIEGCNVDRHDSAEKKLHSFTSYSNIGTGNNNDIIEVMGSTSRDIHSTKEDMDPEALVYKKLWLEAEDTLRSMKYEKCVVQGKI